MADPRKTPGSLGFEPAACSTHSGFHSNEPPPEFRARFRESMPDAYRQRFAEEESCRHAAVAWRRRRHATWLQLQGHRPPFELCAAASHRLDLMSSLSAATVATRVDVATVRTYSRLTAAGDAEAIVIGEVRPKRGSVARQKTLADVETELRTLFHDLLTGSVSVSDLIRRNKDTLRPGPSVQTEVDIHRDEDGQCWLRVTSADRPGLLAAITDALLQLQVWPIVSEVSTMGGIAVDRFGLVAPDGSPLDDKRWRETRDAVRAAVDTAHRALS